MLQCFVDGHFQFKGDQLRYLIRQRIRQRHHPRHIANGSARRHGAEGNDLRHPIRAVFADHIVNDLLPSLGTKVNIKVRHADPLRIKEPLKEQVVADRVDGGNTHAIGAQAARAGATTGPHRNIMCFGVLHKVVHDQIVIHISHLLDGGQFVFQTLRNGGVRMVAVAAAQPLGTQPPEIGQVVPLRCCKGGQL